MLVFFLMSLKDNEEREQLGNNNNSDAMTVHC